MQRILVGSGKTRKARHRKGDPCSTRPGNQVRHSNSIILDYNIDDIVSVSPTVRAPLGPNASESNPRGMTAPRTTFQSSQGSSKCLTYRIQFHLFTTLLFSSRTSRTAKQKRAFREDLTTADIQMLLAHLKKCMTFLILKCLATS